nr:MAG TPA: hypothetical protein [Caudoviricetes sp.]
MIVVSPQIISHVSIHSYTRNAQFAFHYRTISPSGGSQILRLLLLLDFASSSFYLFLSLRRAYHLGFQPHHLPLSPTTFLFNISRLDTLMSH